MTRNCVLSLILLVGVTLSLGACDPHGWRKIRVEASYTEADGLTIDSEAHDIGVSGPGDELSWALECEGCPKGTEWKITDWQIVADLHQLTDNAVEMFHYPDRGLLSTLEARGLEPLQVLARGMVQPDASEMEVQEEQGPTVEEREALAAMDLELGAQVRTWLGIEMQDPEMGKAREVFDLKEPGWVTWAQMDQAIKARSKRDAETDKQDELWKYAVEIRAPGWKEEEANLEEIEEDAERCERNPKRACWDPHNYNHPVY